MRVVVVGREEDLHVARTRAAFRHREDILVERVANLAAASGNIGGKQGLFVVLVESLDDSALADILSVTSRSSAVLALLAAESRELRAAAFSAGCADVMFPPHEDARIESAAVALLGGHLRAEPRRSVERRAVVRTHQGSELAASIVNISRGGVRLEVAGVLSSAAIIQIRLAASDRDAIPALYARVLSTNNPEFGKQDIRAQWLALTFGESEFLSELVEASDEPLLKAADRSDAVHDSGPTATLPGASRALQIRMALLVLVVCASIVIWISAHRD